MTASPPRRPKRLTAHVRIRLTPEEKAQLEAQALLAGLSLSELSRRFLLGRQVQTHQALLEVNELRRLGGLFKHVHHQSQGAYSQETLQVIRLIEAYLKARISP